MAPGFRDAESNRGAGALHSVGYHGYSWTSMITESLTLFWDFDPDGLYPHQVNGRGNGFPLRCLQE